MKVFLHVIPIPTTGSLLPFTTIPMSIFFTQLREVDLVRKLEQQIRVLSFLHKGTTTMGTIWPQRSVDLYFLFSNLLA